VKFSGFQILSILVLIDYIYYGMKGEDSIFKVRHKKYGKNAKIFFHTCFFLFMWLLFIIAGMFKDGALSNIFVIMVPGFNTVIWICTLAFCLESMPYGLILFLIEGLVHIFFLNFVGMNHILLSQVWSILYYGVVSSLFLDKYFKYSITKFYRKSLFFMRDGLIRFLEMVSSGWNKVMGHKKREKGYVKLLYYSSAIMVLSSLFIFVNKEEKNLKYT